MRNLQIDEYFKVWLVIPIVFFHALMYMEIEFVCCVSSTTFTDVIVHSFPEIVRFARFGNFSIAKYTPEIVHNISTLTCYVAFDCPLGSISHSKALALLNVKTT